MRAGLSLVAAVAVRLLVLSDVARAGLIQPELLPPRVAAPQCNSDNCLRAMLRKEREDSVYSFCTSLLSTTLPTTATAAIPTFLANCGPSSQVARVSSACPCFLASLTTTTTPTTTTSTTEPTTAPPTTVPTSASTPISNPATTCPPASTTTITLPGETSTCSVDTIIVTAPGTTTTVTAPASTVTVSTAGPTVTASPPAASCAQPVVDSGFESAAPGAYPWLFAQSGTGSYSVGQSIVGGSGAGFPPGSNFSPHSGRVALNVMITNPSPGGFIRFWQTFSPCGGATTYRPRLWYGTNAASTGTVTFTLRIFSLSVSTPTAAPVPSLFSIKTMPAPTFGSGGWVEVVFDVWNSPVATTATLLLDVSTDRQSTTVWLDDFTIRAGAA